MALPVIAGCARATYSGALPNGVSWANVMAFRYAAGASKPGPTEIANADALIVRLYAGQAFGTGNAWFANCTTNVSLLQSTWYVLDGAAPPVVFNHAVNGSEGGVDSLPTQNAPVLTLRTALRGRQNRGRIYMPVPSELITGVEGLMSSNAVNQFLAQANGLISALAAIQWEWGVLSTGPYKPPAAGQPTPSPHFTPITACTMDLKMDVQRRRK